MYKNKKILAIIPARAGSKGIKNKNIRKLNGYPLLAYSIAAAKEIPGIDKIICSTDSEKIAKIAEKYGAEIPFIRPKELALDDVPDFPVFHHAIEFLFRNQRFKPDIIFHLRPTSPIRYVDDMRKALDIIIDNESADSLRSVVEPKENPYKMWKIGRDGYLKPLLKIKNIKEPYNMPRQKLPNVYWQIGTIDIIKYNTLMVKKSMTGEKIIPYVVKNEINIDIDNIIELKLARLVIPKIDCVKP